MRRSRVRYCDLHRVKSVTFVTFPDQEVWAGFQAPGSCVISPMPPGG